jgi:hypothetical protein
MMMKRSFKFVVMKKKKSFSGRTVLLVVGFTLQYLRTYYYVVPAARLLWDVGRAQVKIGVQLGHPLPRAL